MKLLGITGSDGNDMKFLMEAYDKTVSRVAKERIVDAMNDIAKKQIKSYKEEMLLKALKDAGIA